MLLQEQTRYNQKRANMTKKQELQHFIATACMLLAAVFSTTKTTAKNGEQQVPLADPFILYDKGVYYAYGTGSDNGIPVYISRDLKTGNRPRETTRFTLHSTNGIATATNGSGPRRCISSTEPITCTILQRNTSVSPHPNRRSGHSDKGETPDDRRPQHRQFALHRPKWTGLPVLGQNRHMQRNLGLRTRKGSANASA